MSLQSRLVAEEFIKQELRGIFSSPADQEQLRSWIALGLGQKATQNVGNLIGLPVFSFLLGDYQKAAAADSVTHGFLVHCILSHGHCSFELLGSRL